MRMMREFLLIIAVTALLALWMLFVSQSVRWIVIFQMPRPPFLRSGNELLSMNDFEDSGRSDFRLLTTRPDIDGLLRLPVVFNSTISDEDCELVLDDPFYANRLPVLTIVDSDGVDATWSTSCDEIKKRGRYATTSLSEEESEFPIAFARIVYKDYHLQELLLNIMYAPQNIFCYAVDAKAPLLFREQIANLSNCFPNVFLTTQQFQVDSAGHNTTRSFLECLRLLNSKPKWKYAILLQNNDIPLKTNYETVEILKVLNGSNDINVGPPNKGRIPRNMNWTYRALNLFQDNSKNDNRVLEIAKGSTSVSLSRSFVKFVVDELNLTTLVDRFESMEYGIDEMIFPSLHADDQLDAPGGFTRHCIGKYNNLITRYVSWQRTSSGKPRPCFSGRYRHEICVFGLADLSTLSTSKSLFANKMMPEYDYGAIACWLKTLARRRHTRFHTDASRNDYYSQRLPVRFHNERAKWRKNLDAFDCEA